MFSRDGLQGVGNPQWRPIVTQNFNEEVNGGFSGVCGLTLADEIESNESTPEKLTKHLFSMKLPSQERSPSRLSWVFIITNSIRMIWRKRRYVNLLRVSNSDGGLKKTK